jgi:hypothetical protein
MQTYREDELRQHTLAVSAIADNPSASGRDGEKALLPPAHDEAIALLCSTALEPLFRLPHRRGIHSAWWGHVPFAGWITRVARPRVFVELGTFSGVSYAAFCQAVLADRTSCLCHAVDTWCGDPHTSIYDDAVYLDFKAFHDAHYQSFSQLHRCTFDDARNRFENGSVDLLHIDGYHTYEAVRHDFETWLPKLSSRGIILFHDTNEKKNNFGVWRLWEEVSVRWPSFSFVHSHGLGVLCVGPEPPRVVAQLCDIRDVNRIETIRQRFALLGDRWYAESEACRLQGSMSWRVTAPLRSASSSFSWVARQAQRATSFARWAAARQGTNPDPRMHAARSLAVSQEHDGALPIYSNSMQRPPLDAS